jgi:glucose dehydrogenase
MALHPACVPWHHEENEMGKGSQKRGASYWCLVVLSVFIIVIGLPLIPGGIWLIVLGGSRYYVFAGLGLVISGFAMINQRVWGAGLYFVVWLGTAAWSLWEVGLDPWPLVPRLFGLTLVAIGVLAVLPGMRRRARPQLREA